MYYNQVKVEDQQLCIMSKQAPTRAVSKRRLEYGYKS